MLGGHCAGNWVAFEMAQQLQAQGEEVSLLVLVDSEPPNIEPPHISPIKYYLNRIAFYWRDGRFWDALIWKLGLAYQRLVILRMGEENARRVAAVRNAHACAHRNYHSGTFNGDVLLIRSHESTTLQDKDWHLRWSELINGRLRHKVVPGTHAGLLIEPSVSQMAAEIRAAIDKTLLPPGAETTGQQNNVP
jgi:thioesterase domain-containing protein